MTQEQKAKAYDEALSKVKDMLSYKEVRQEDMEYLFPELAESEDERIRKKLIFDFQVLGKTEWGDLKVKDILAWLEKQGEQKPNPYSGTSFEYNGHIWGMCARDGGAEVSMDGNLKAFISSDASFIYPNIPQPNLALKSALEEFKEEKVDNANKVEQNLANSAKTCKKSQRMISAEAKEALYDKPATIDIDKMVYDYANNKERGNEEFGKPVNCMIRAYRQGLNDAVEKIILKPVWSEEDETGWTNTMIMIKEVASNHYTKDSVKLVIDWLKSLKQRIGG